MDIALTLRAYREALGLSQFELAEIVDVQQSTWSRWENGDREPRDPVGVLTQLHGLVEARDELFDQMCNWVEAQNSQSVELATFASDEAFWNSQNEDVRAARLPASLHRSAAALCAFYEMEENGIAVSLVAAD